MAGLTVITLPIRTFRWGFEIIHGGVIMDLSNCYTYVRLNKEGRDSTYIYYKEAG